MKPFPSQVDSANFKKLFTNIDYILTDCDGVLFLQNNAIAGAAQFLNDARKKGKKVLFCTNNSTKTRRQIKIKLNDLGFICGDDEVMVTSYAAGLYLKKKNFDKKVYVFGSSGIEGEFKLLNINFTGIGPDDFHSDKQATDFSKIQLDPEIQAVVCGFDYELSYAKLVRACSYAKKVSDTRPDLFITTNLDETMPTKYSNLCVPGTGALVRCITTAVGRDPVSMGKPSKFFFACLLLCHPDIDPNRCLMIGDRLDTDIKFASINELKYSLFVQTGVSSLDDVKRSIEKGEDELVPTHYCKDLGELNKFLNEL